MTQATIVRVGMWFAVRVSSGGYLARWNGELAIQTNPFTFACEQNAIRAAREYLE